jgi:3',5'-cyclic AMP phosphodiesterase CpdA
VSFTLAHLSDAHLPNLQISHVLKNFSPKRVIGAFSWFLNRRRWHFQTVADAVQASIISAKPDHIAFTGDAVNIAAWDEFKEAARWMQRFGPADQMSFVPGNHDTYVNVPWVEGLNLFAPWMRPDRHEPVVDNTDFPYVRLRRNVALIGLNSGLPQGFRSAGGTLGERQLLELGNLLSMLDQQGFYRIVMLHHPPLPGMNRPRKALTDAAQLQTVLAENGCNLVLHGHNHHQMLTWLDSKHGLIPIIGAPSASINGDQTHEAAGWNLYTIRRVQGSWSTDMTRHQWNKSASQVEAQTPVTLLPP